MFFMMSVLVCSAIYAFKSLPSGSTPSHAASASSRVTTLHAYSTMVVVIQSCWFSSQVIATY